MLGTASGNRHERSEMLKDERVACSFHWGHEWKDFKLLLLCTGSQTGRVNCWA